jgi:peroxiredoxin Q/BCP
MQTFQMDLEQFQELKTQVLGVSGDDLDTHKKFAKKYNITFPLISDRLRTVKELYGCKRTS